MVEAEIWLDALEELMDGRIDDASDIEQYTGNLMVCVIDQDEYDAEDTEAIFIKSMIKFDELDKLDSIMGGDEAGTMRKDYEERAMSAAEKEETVDLVLYTNTWTYVTTLTTTHELLAEKIE
jgi:hypothetical protein